MDITTILRDFVILFTVHANCNLALIFLPLLWFLRSGRVHLPWQHDWHALSEAGSEHRHTVRRDAGQITHPERRSTPNKPWNRISEESRNIVTSAPRFRVWVCGMNLCCFSEIVSYCGRRKVARLTQRPSLWFQYSFASFKWYKIWKSGVRADARFCFSSRAPTPPTPISEVLAAGRKGKQTQQAAVVELFIRPQSSTQSSAPTHGLTRKHQSPAHIKNTQMEVCDVVSFPKKKKKVSRAVKTCNPLADKAVWLRGWEGPDTPWPALVHMLRYLIPT